MLAVAGKPDKSGTISDCCTTNEAVAVLFGKLRSLVALVVPVTVTVPAAVGVPETVHVIAEPGVTIAAGDVGEQTLDNPAGNPLMAQVAAVASIYGAAALEHVYVPVYGTLSAAGPRPAKLTLMSERDVFTNVHVTVDPTL